MAPQTASVRVILTGVRSTTHLVYAASWLRTLLGTGVPVEVVVLDVGAGFGHARVDEGQVRHYLPDDPAMTLTTRVLPEHWLVAPGVERVLLSIGAPGTRAWSRLVLAGRGRRPRVVVVDEGIGSFGDVRARREAYRRQGGRGAWPAVRAAVVSTGHHVLTGLHWSLYRRSGLEWEVVPEVAEEFRLRLDGLAPAPGAAVYLTQPWPDIGVMSERAYLDHLTPSATRAPRAGLALAAAPAPE